jgi:hypothetical protein
VAGLRSTEDPEHPYERATGISPHVDGLTAGQTALMRINSESRASLPTKSLSGDYLA